MFAKILIAAWFSMMGIGVVVWCRSDFVPGPIGIPVPPESGDYLCGLMEREESSVRPEIGAATDTNRVDPADSCLILFLHTQCPCSLASLENFAKVVKEFGCHSMVICQDDQSQRLVSASKSLGIDDSIEFLCDTSGEYRTRFGATTSGHCVLVSQRDEILFSGGITPGRGQRGTCLPLLALQQILRGATVSTSNFPVFGCLLD